MRGRGLLCKKPPPSRSLPKKITVGRFWGRGRFSERSASPPDPLSRRAAGNRLGCSFGVERPCECGWSPIGLVVVTAADRAAATFAACGGNPSARISRAPPLSGEALPRGSAAEDTFFASRAPSIRRYKKSRWRKPSAFLVSSCSRPQRSTSAAALSAAVDSTNSQGTEPPLRRNQLRRTVPTQTPAALRERGVWGERRFSQRSGLSPQNSPVPLYHFDAEFFADLGAVAAANAFRLVADALAVFDVKGSLAAAGYALTAATAVIVNHQAAGLAPRPC